MVLTFLSKTQITACKTFVFLCAISLGFNAFSQQISIGFPTNGIEGGSTGSEVLFKVFLENGDVNSSGAPMTGSIAYSGVAVESVDYVAVTSFSIPNGGDTIVISIPVIDDALIECDESIIATISSVNVGTIGTATSASIIIDNECSIGTDEINLDKTNIEIYPNPAHSLLFVTAKDPIRSFTIFDLNGREMAFGYVNGQKLELDVNVLPSGFYVLTIVLNDATSISKKVLKE